MVAQAGAGGAVCDRAIRQLLLKYNKMPMTDHIDFVSDPDDDKDRDQKEEQEMPSEVEQLRLELDQAKDRALRSLADLENFRARAARQSVEDRKYANIDLMRELLGVWDNIGRALEAADKTHHLESLVEGVQMVYQQLLDVLKKFHCEKMEALHQPFDPNFQQSIAQIPSGDYPSGTVIEVTQAGFVLHERVVRPAQVVLSSGNTSTGSTTAGKAFADKTHENSTQEG